MIEVLDINKNEWEILQTTGDKPTPRNNHASCVIGDFLYIHGGHDGEDWLDDFYQLDTKKLSWKTIIVTEYKPKPRACHTLSKIGRKIYMYGGYDGKDSFKHFEIFDTETHLWSIHDLNKLHREPFIPVPRNAHTANVINKKIYIFGGHYQNYHLNDLAIYDTITMKWESPKLNGVTPTGLRGHTATHIFNKIYIFGGYDGNNRNNDIYRITLDDYYSTKISNNKETIFCRQRHVAVLKNNSKILFFGGYDGNKWLNSLDELNVSVLENNLSIESTRINLKNNFKLLLNNSEFADITFVINEKYFYANKCVLFARSEFFRNMFSDYMIEKDSNIIQIDKYDFKTFEYFMEYIYTFEVSCRDYEDLIKLYELADSYSNGSLKKYCEELLMFMITESNVIEIFVLSYKYDSINLENFALEFISRHRKQLCYSSSLNLLLEYSTLMTRILSYL